MVDIISMQDKELIKKERISTSDIVVQLYVCKIIVFLFFLELKCDRINSSLHSDFTSNRRAFVILRVTDGRILTYYSFSVSKYVCVFSLFSRVIFSCSDLYIFFDITYFTVLYGPPLTPYQLVDQFVGFLVTTITKVSNFH